MTTRAHEILLRRVEEDNFSLMHPLTSSSTASHIWRRVRTKMGLQGEHEFVLHAFRHTYGSTLANAGMDAFRIQQLMGHANIVTTQGYVKVSMDSLDVTPSILEKRVQNVTIL